MPLTKHHAPPRCYHEPDTFVLHIAMHRHRAYHELLGIPHSFDEASRVLAERRRDYEQGQLDERLVRRFQLLFPAVESYEEARQILLRDWWTPRRKKKK